MRSEAAAQVPAAVRGADVFDCHPVVADCEPSGRPGAVLSRLVIRISPKPLSEWGGGNPSSFIFFASGERV